MSYFFSICKGKILKELIQVFFGFGIQLKKTFLSQEEKIFHFYQYAVPDQGIFTVILTQVLQLIAVASVNRADSCEI